MKLYTVSVSEKIIGSIPELWQMLAVNFGNIASYSKELKHSKYIGKLRKGIHVQRYCEMLPKGFMLERIIEWEDQRSLAFEIVDSSIPLKPGSSLRFSFVQLNQDQISIKVTGQYRLKYFGFLSPILYPKMKELINKYIADIQNSIQ